MPRMMIVGRCLLVSLLLGAGCAKSGGPHDAPPVAGVAAGEPAPLLDSPPVELPAAEPKKETPAAETKKETPAAEPKKDPSPAPIAEAPEFKFAADQGGKILAKLLAPSPLSPLGQPANSGPSVRGLPGNIARPNVPATKSSAAPPRLTAPPLAAVRPKPLADRVPLELAQLGLSLPERIEMPAGELTSLQTPDVKIPVALPILARPSMERASLEDPTVEFTARSIVSDKLPLRSAPAPFVRVTLPDPFEYAEAAKAKITLKDDPLIAIGNPPPLKP